jgi:multidrug resistance efflux pump
MRGKWLLFSVLAVLAGVALGALSLRNKGPQTAPQAPSASAALIARDEIRLSGAIRPQHVVGVGSQVNGNIEAFLADVGQDVFQGQVLARIGASNLETDREAAAQAVESAQDRVAKAESAIIAARMEASRAGADAQRARAALDRAQKTFARQQTLYAAGATPRNVFDRSQQDYEAALKDAEIMGNAERAANESAKAMIESLDVAKKALAEKTRQFEDAQGALADAELRAPVDGLVVGRKGEVGKPAEEAGSDMFQIATDIYALEVVLEAPPATLKQLHPGQQALVTVLDLQTGGMPGSVKEIQDKEGQVIVEFNSALPAVRPGMRADVRLKLE